MKNKQIKKELLIAVAKYMGDMKELIDRYGLSEYHKAIDATAKLADANYIVVALILRAAKGISCTLEFEDGEIVVTDDVAGEMCRRFFGTK